VLVHMRERALASHVIARLAKHPDCCPVPKPGTPISKGISALKVKPHPMMPPRGPWGNVKAHRFLSIIVSDDASQFNVGQQGLCWGSC
jgi:hypothetical protein